jgi:DNA (cytosine-5)-methyltransferase 1
VSEKLKFTHGMLAEAWGEIIVDSFAGGGGASTGIEMALGRSPDIAINHDATALAMHEVNHPSTVHLTEDIWAVDPRTACAGRPVGLLWASPDCKHFSKAKGGKPVEKSIRSLAWVVVHWANTVAPRVIILENVEEFSTWGPLGDDGRPCPLQKGVTFKRWVGELERLGYVVEWRELRACDFGAPTIRKRLFLIARRDGRPIVWPQASHGDPKSEAVKHGALKPWRTAAEIIDWSMPCPSIFDTVEEIMAKHGLRSVRPLAGASMARLAKGVRRYVVDAAEPFIVNLTHQGGARSESLGEPLRTATAAHRGEKAVVAPHLVRTAHGDVDRNGKKRGQAVHSLEEPHGTVLGSNDHAVASAFMVPRYGERPGQEPRTRSIEDPMATAVPTGNGGSLATVFISAAQQGGNNRDAANPLHTLTASDGDQNQVVAAFMAQNNYLEPGHAMEEGVSTVVGKGSTQSLAAAHIVRQFGTGIGHAVDEPSRTVMADGQGKTQVSAAFLQKYYGADQDPQLGEPLHTTTTKDRFGLAETLLAAPPFGPEHYTKARKVADLLRAHSLWDDREFVTVEVDGITFVIVDIGLRMLVPRELFRAQGFPDGYVIDRCADGSPITKTAQVSKCGNSVCPPIAAALVGANYRPEEAEPAPEFLEAAE